jgi:hypothetical protein
VKKLAASVHVHAAVMHLSKDCGTSDDSQDGTGPHTNLGHGNLGGGRWKSRWGCTGTAVLKH